jgi:hypothetical protein
MKLNPYEQGVADYKNKVGGAFGKPSSNPFLAFSAKWAMYNRGYNTSAGLVDKK